MHDVGKPYCVRNFGNMHGHESVSANTVRFVLGEKGLRYPNAVVDEVEWLCKYHMYDMARNTKEAKLRIFVAQNFDRIDKLCALMEADDKARGMDEEPRPIRLAEIKQKLIDENAPLKISDLALDGSTLIMEGIQPVRIGGVLGELWRACVIEPRLNNEQWLLERVRKFKEE